MLLLLSQIIHNLPDRFLNIIDTLAYISLTIPISSTRPMMFEDISSKRSCICFSMFCTNWFSYFVLGSSDNLRLYIHEGCYKNNNRMVYGRISNIWDWMDGREEWKMG